MSATPNLAIELWEVLGDLWNRSTGEADVAARPDRNVEDVWPSAARPPGVNEALDWLASDLPNALPRILLLVGGPGAGKSHATSTAVQGMELASTVEPGLAHRKYEYHDRSRKLVVVNDATISDGRQGMPLVADIDQALSRAKRDPLRTNLMACVNRGILIEEFGQLRNKTESAGALVVSWLANGERRLGSFSLESCSSLRYGRSAQLTYAGHPLADLMAIFMDECSLFEVSPEIAISQNRISETFEYQIRRLRNRKILSEGGRTAPASDLLQRVLAKIGSRLSTSGGSSNLQADPLAANFHSLQSATVLSSLLTIARSAELATSTRMTYRELWGYVARLLVGSATENLARDDLGAFVLQNQPKGVDLLTDFHMLRRLSALRLSQSIFGAGFDARASTNAENDPVLRLTASVDPILDAVPGNSPDDPRAGWADPVNEAFEAQSDVLTPLSALVATASRQQGEKNSLSGFLDIVSQFDWKIDEVYRELISDDSLSDAERLRATSWYGAYLTRLYAVSLGITAFRREIDALIEVLDSTPRLPDVIRKPMETLLRPKRKLRNGESEALLPLFDSRTEPVTGHLIGPKMAVRVEDGKLSTRLGAGDQVFLELRRESELQGTISIDFALVREALACVDDNSGVTDLVDVTAPRLERVRSSRLRSKHLNEGEIRIASGVESYLVTLRRTVQNDHE